MIGNVGIIVLAALCAMVALCVTISRSSADDGAYGCFVYDGAVFWDGQAHPAVFDLKPGPGAGVYLGADCDAFPSSDAWGAHRVYSPSYVAPQTPTATPEPTPTPSPTPTPTPTPVPTPTAIPTPTPGMAEVAWPYIPYCFWNEGKTAMFCYW